MTMQVQLRKYKGDPILFFINYNDRGWWLECYDRFGHSEAALSFRDEHTTLATFDEEANRFALEWARSEPRVEIEVVETLTPPDLPYLGN